MDRRVSYQDFGIGLLTGLALGALLGILFAPEAGESTREKIAAGAGNIKLTTAELIDNAKHSLDLAANKLEGVFGSQEKNLRKRLTELKDELEKYNLSGA